MIELIELLYYILCLVTGMLIGEILIVQQASKKLYGTRKFWTIKGKIIKKCHMNIYNKEI